MTQHTLKASQEGSRVVMSPVFLDFQDKPMSIPAVEVVRIYNADDRGPKEREELVVRSVTSDSPSFYTSFYRPIAIAPGKDFALEVVFLPRAVNSVDSSVVIHTSAGNFVLQVSGRGIPNPYKVQPFAGIKVPVGEAYEPSIEIYNPHYEVLSVREIYTSSNALNLLLPAEALNYTMEKCGHTCGGVEHIRENGGESERMLKLWDVAPHTRRTLIKLRFISQKTGKFQGFVNIKTSTDNIIVQVDVSVVSGAVHKTPEELDFGILTLQDTKVLNLTLLNSGATLLQASDLQIAGSSDPNLDFQFQPTPLPPKRDVIIATLTYSARSEGTFKGKLLLRTNDTNPVFARIEVPYRVRVLAGYLSYSTAQTTFASFDSKLTQSGEMIKVDKLEPVTQEILLTNKFSVPLVLFSAEIEDTQLRVVDFVPSQIVEPGESWPVLKIEFRPRSSFLLFTTHLHLTTNASLISIPLHICHGKLGYRLPADAHQYSVGPLASSDSSDHDGTLPSHTGATVKVHTHSFDVQSQHISFGTVPINEVQTLTLNVTNHNPIKLPLLGLWTDVEGLNLKLESVWNAQGYRSVSSVAFQPHRPGIFDEKPSSTSPSRASSATASKSSSERKRNVSKKSQSSTLDGNDMKKSSLLEKDEVFELLPGHSALFSLELKSTRDTATQGWIYFATPYERSAINVSYTSFAGKLELSPERFEFSSNLRSIIPLYIEHTYSRSITITSITSNDARLQVLLPKSPSGSNSSIGSQDERHLWLRPNTHVKYGSVAFYPLASSKTVAELQSIGASLPALPVRGDTLDDAEAQKLISSIDLSPQKRHNDIRATLTVTTDLRTVHAFPVRVQRWRPTIIGLTDISMNTTIDFGLVEIETGVQERFINVTNPLITSPIVVQLQLACSSTSAAGIEKDISLDKKSDSCAGDYSFAKSALKFAILNPGETLSLGPVVYHPSREGSCSSYLFVRSNLTTIEQVLMHGIGGGGRLTFSKEVRVAKDSAVSSASYSSLMSDVKSTNARHDTKAKKELAMEIRPVDQLRFAIKDALLKGCEESEDETVSSSKKHTDTIESIASSWTPPVLTKTVVVENKGDMPLFIQSVFLASPASSDTLASSWRRVISASSPSTKRIGGFTVVDDGIKSLGVDGNKAVQPGDRIIVSLSYSPDFTTSESRYDLVVRSNSSREFRFPLIGALSEEKLATCASKFRVSRGSFSEPNIQTPVIIAFAGLLGLAVFVWDRRRRQAAACREDNVLPTNNTPNSTPTKPSVPSERDSALKNKGKDNSPIASGNSKTRGAEDLENHATPCHIASAASHAAPNASNASTGSTSKEQRKKDKKDKANQHHQNGSTHSDAAKATQSSKSSASDAARSPSKGNANNMNTSESQTAHPTAPNKSTTPPPVSPNSTPATSPDSAPVASKKASSKGDHKTDSDKHAVASESIPTSPTSASAAPASQTSSKKKDKKDKKDKNEPIFTIAEPPAPGSENKSSHASTAHNNHVSGSPPTDASHDHKNKKLNGTGTLPATPVSASEKQDSPTATNAGQLLSPTRESSSPPASDGAGAAASDSSDLGRVSPQPVVRQTLVPAKRPSSKPLPKYARKDGLSKDAPPSSTNVVVTSNPSSTGSSAANTLNAPTNLGSSTSAQVPIKPTKESKKNRQVKEYKQKQPLNPLPNAPEPVASTTHQSSSTFSAPLPAPVPRLPESQKDSSWRTSATSTTPPSSSFAIPSSANPSSAHGTANVPIFPGGTLAQLHDYPAIGSGFNPSLSSSPHMGPSSPAAFTNPLLVSPGSLSASRYDYGRRALSNSGSFAGGSLNFDFSTAPTFDLGGSGSSSGSSGSGSGRSIVRENSATPPAGATPPMMRWYNPMAPGNGSVENLLAALREPVDGSSSSSDYGSSVATLNYNVDNLPFFEEEGPIGFVPSSVDWSTTGPIAPGVGSAWSAPTTDRAVEENVSNLSMLGLGAPRTSSQHHQPATGFPSGAVPRTDGATSPFFLGLQNVVPDPDGLTSLDSPSVPPGLDYVNASSSSHSISSGVGDGPLIPSPFGGPAGPYTAMPPNSPFSHLSFFSGSNLDDPDFF